jgi:hypothetical protein
MADFGQVTGQKVARSQKRAQKFSVKLQAAIERIPTLFETGNVAADAVLKATGKFLASFGTDVARLNRISRQRLTVLDPQQQNMLKTRAIAEIVAITRTELADQIERFARGRIDRYGLRDNIRDSLRVQALASAVIGVGGVGNLTENTLLAVQRQLSNQFRLLDGFIEQVSDAPSATERARLAQYANSAHTIAQTAQRQFRLDTLGTDDSDLEERRVLSGAEHCDDCLELAGLGWVESGVLPAIGQGTVCGNACRCTIETRIKGQGQDTPNAADAERLQT